MTKTIERDELRKKIDAAEAFVLIEALPEAHYRQRHLPGAQLFPLDRTRELAAQLIGDADAHVVVYCASETCQNSHQAARQLAQLGYRNVRVYAGGKQDWERAGLPFEAA